MLIIDTAAAMAHALNLPLDPALRRFLVLRRDQLGENLESAARFLIVSSETLATVEAEVGYPLTVDGVPTWEYVALHPGGWGEIVLILSDDGPAEVILVPNRHTTDQAIIDLLRPHGVFADERVSTLQG